MAIIAKIRLANGQPGYYDDYSKLYLTPSNPEAFIASGTNLYQIKKSIKSGRLKLVEGSLTEETKAVEVSVSDNIKKVTKKEVKIEAPAEKPVSEVLEVKPEAVEEPVIETAIEVEKPKRVRRKKNAEPAVETVEEPAEIEVTEEIPQE